MSAKKCSFITYDVTTEWCSLYDMVVFDPLPSDWLLASERWQLIICDDAALWTPHGLGVVGNRLTPIADRWEIFAGIAD